jgi:hypothetical protein
MSNNNLNPQASPNNYPNPADQTTNPNVVPMNQPTPEFRPPNKVISRLPNSSELVIHLPNQAQNQTQNQLVENQVAPQTLYNPADPSYYSSNDSFNTFGNTPINAEPAGLSFNEQFQSNFKKVKENKVVINLISNWWIVLIVVILLFSLGFGILYFLGLQDQTVARTSLNVVGNISAPSRSPSGSLSEWNVKVENNENLKLERVKLILKFDNTFTFAKSINQDPVNEPNTTFGSAYDLGELQPFGVGGSSAIITLQGTLSGTIDTEAIMGGTVSFQVEGDRQTFANELKVASTRIGAPELTIDELTAPNSIKNGNEEDIFLNFKNSSDRELRDLRIRLTYPNNDFYISSELQLSKTSQIQRSPSENDNIWLIPQLPRFTPQQLKIRGRFIGVPGEIKTIRVEIATKAPSSNDFIVLAERSRTVNIVGDIIDVQTKLAGRDDKKTFEQDDTLTMEINYRNTSTRNIENVKVLAWMEDPAEILNYNSVAYTGGDRGSYTNGRFEWTQAGAPALRLLPPNGSGKLSFTIKTKEGKNFLNGKNQSQFTLQPRAILSATAIDDISVVGSEYKAQGELKFEAKADFQKIPKDAPQKFDQACNQTRDLVEGKPVCYLVTWTVSNTQNNINDVQVRTRTTLKNVSAFAPWDQTSVTPITESNNISYDRITGEIVWRLGNVPGYTGINQPARTVSFVISFIPEQAQLNSGGVSLYEQLVATGTDDFTLQQYRVENPGARTAS